MLQFRRSIGAQNTVLSVHGQGSFRTCTIDVSLTQTAVGLQKAEGDSARFRGHFPYSGNNIIPAFESPFRLDGPNALVG